MGKRKNTKIKSIARAGDRTTSSSDYGGSGGNNNRFSAFEFTDDDFRPEFESRKTLSKYGTKSPNKKPVHNRLAVDKYAFLESFAQGTKGKQNVSRNDVSDVAVTDCGFQDITFVPDVAMSLGSSNYEQKPFSFPNCHCSECYCGAKSCAPRSRRSECYSTGNNKILYVDSDEDGLMGSRSRSSLNHAEDEGLLEEQSPEFGANNNDYEAEVAVAPHYAKYGKIYYTNCLLTFSKRCIRLKGSPLHERKRTHCLELLTSDILSIEHQPFESVKAEAVILRFKLKDTSTGETSNCNSGSDELEFVLLDDPQWSVKQEEIQSLDLQYKVAWERNTRECNIEESFENMVYPDGDPDAVFISREDIELLQPRTFINDTIIDFYMKYLLNKINPEEQHRFHFFNTFFFQKLVNVCPDSSRAWEGRDAFESLRKWTRNVNIFKADYVFIPVNFSLHWSLIIICHPGEVANLKDKEDSCKVPCILHMDSIRGSHGGFKHLIRRMERAGNEPEEDVSMKFFDVEFVSLQLPQQENLFDCGLFLLHYAELFLDLALNFSTAEYLDVLNKDWFLPAEVSLKKRDHIRKLIHRIVEENAHALKDPPSPCDDECLQSSGMKDGDSSAYFKLRNTMEASYSGGEFNSSDDCYIEGWQSPVTDECFKYKLQVPTNQFSTLSLPMEEAFENQTSFRQGGITTIQRADTPMPPRCQPTRFRTGEIKDPSEKTSGASSDKSLIIIESQTEDDCGPEDANEYGHIDRYANESSMSTEDLAAYVVEDSEDESETVSSIWRIKRPSIPIQPICLDF